MEKLSPSFWERDIFLQKADVIIIGSGIVGLTAAIRIKEEAQSLKVMVVERGILPLGASTRNAGFACIGSMTELLADLQHHTSSEVFALVARRWNGLQKLQKRLGRKAIQFEQCGNYELFGSNEEQSFEQCREQIDYFNKQLKAITGVDNCFAVKDSNIDSFGFQQTKHLILNRAEGQLHTGHLMNALLQLAYQKEIRVLNATTINSIHENGSEVELICENGWHLKAAQVLVATNGFAPQLFPQLSVQPARNQVLITKPIIDLKVKGCFHYDQGYIYFRNIGDRLLLGGARNHDLVAESTTKFGQTQIIQNALLHFLTTTILPDVHFEVDYWWSGIMGVGDSKKPIVKQLSDRIFTAVRLGGMGIAIGSLVGEEGADLLLTSRN